MSGLLSSKFGASSWKSAYTVTNIASQFIFEYYSLFYDASLGIFTPFGEFYIGIGLCYMLFLSNRNYLKTSRDQYFAPDNAKEPEKFISTDHY